MWIVQRNVEKYYVVVGVMELWEETLQVLEHKLPGVFTGLTQLYKEKYNEKVNGSAKTKARENLCIFV